MREMLKICGLWIAIMGCLWCASYMVGYGFYSGKSIASLQADIRLIDEYMLKQKESDNAE